LNQLTIIPCHDLPSVIRSLLKVAMITLSRRFPLIAADIGGALD
jgi:hypothetical protein